MENGTAFKVREKRKGKVVVSWTGGKDGCFACHKAILEGYDVSYLLNFREMKKLAPHNLNHDLLSAQSRAIGIPIIQLDFVSYEEEFKHVVRTLNHNGAGLKGAIFGHIEIHEDLVRRICSDLGIELIMPLWKRDSGQIVTDFIDAGFEAIVVSAKANLLGSEWLGRKIDREFVSQLREFNSAIDVGGEYGEFHTFVTDGPLFKNWIRIVDNEKILEDGYWRLDILEFAIGD